MLVTTANSKAIGDYGALPSTKEGSSSVSRRPLPFASPISANEGRLSVDPNLMNVLEPYPFRLAGQWLIAVKQHDGEVDFYSISS